jgi:flagellar basal body-associated protein FliL
MERIIFIVILLVLFAFVGGLIVAIVTRHA